MSNETNNGTDGGLLKGKPHYDKNGKPLGGIKAIVTDTGQHVELEGGEVIINKEASKKHWKELSKINQSAGGGVPIVNPADAIADTEEYRYGGAVHGKKIEFNPNHLPNKWVYEYAKKIKTNYPKVWALGGNEFGDEAFNNLERALERGHWTKNEEWMYVKWQSFNARHKQDFRIAGVIANLKWLNKVENGWEYMKNIIEKNIDKLYGSDKKLLHGGELKKGIEVEKEHSATAEKLYTHKIKPEQAPKSIAKEDPKYYTKLEEIESKFGLGGTADSSEDLSAPLIGGTMASSMALGGGIENESIKGITEVTYEDNGDTLLYGQKNSKTRISVKNSSQKDIEDELNWEKKMLEKQKADLPTMIKANENIQNSLSSSLKEKDDSRKLLNMAIKNIEILEKIVIPFYQSKVSIHQTETEYKYNLRSRPFSIGTYPNNDNFIRFEEDGSRFGCVIYSEPLSIEVMEEYELVPITDILKYDGKDMLWNNDFKTKVSVLKNDRGTYYVSLVVTANGKESKPMPKGAIDFLKDIKSGKYTEFTDKTSEPVKEKEQYNYNKPLQRSDVDLIETFKNADNTGQIIKFEYNGGFFEWRYSRFGSGSAIHITKYVNLLQLKNPLSVAGSHEIIYNTYNENQTTDEGKFLEFSIAKWNKDDLFGKPKEKQPEPEPKKEKTFKERINVEKTAENFKDIRQSLDEFFTPKWTAQIMFDLAIKHGFKGGSILEPSFGHGVFFDVAIENSSKTELGIKEENLYGFEIYKPNFEVVKKNHPKAKLFDHNFEYQFIDQDIFYRKNKIEKSIDFKNKQFDLVLGNPPYGKHTSPHSFYFDNKMQIRYEGFFIWLALQKLKQGGLVVFIVNSLWLQNGNLYNHQKEQIAKLGDLIDAYRLPNKTFKDTDIATDIVVFRKK